MNKKVLIGFVVMLVLVGASYFYYKSSNSKTLETSEDSQEVENVSTEGSLSDLFAGAGGPSKACTFENTTNSGKSSGVLYTAENKMRGDFSVEVEGKVTESHMIVDGETSYLWQSGQNTGIKSKFGEEDLDIIEDKSNEDKNDGSKAPEGKYECKDWSVDDSFFELPGDVEFASTDAMMDVGGTQLEGSNSCAVCDSLTGESKTQCLKSLDCN